MSNQNVQQLDQKLNDAILSGKAMEGAYKAMRKTAVEAQEVLGVFADGVISGKGWTASFDAMMKKAQRTGGWVRVLANQLDRVRKSSAFKAASDFAQGVNKRVQGPNGVGLRQAVRDQLNTTDKGQAVVKGFDFMKGALSRLGTVAKTVGKWLAAAFEKVTR